MTFVKLGWRLRRVLMARIMAMACSAGLVLFFSPLASAAGPVIVVGDSAQLVDTLRGVRGGETILLRPGIYHAVAKNIRPAVKVLIRSQNPELPATVVGLDLRAVANLTFDTLNFADDGVSGPRPYVIRLSDSENVEFANSVFDGGARGYAHTKADAAPNLLLVKGSRGLIFQHNVVSRYLHGLAAVKSRDILISDNEIHSLQGDGMHFAQVKGINIVRNFFHDFFGSDPKKVTHNDYIQFWTTNTDQPSADIVIRANIFRSGAFQSQVIFFRDQLGDLGKGEMRYRHVLIADNLIQNNNYHGITLASTDGAIIRGNRLEPHPGAGRSSSINVHKSTDVVIRDNIAPRMNLGAGNENVRTRDNILSQSASPTKVRRLPGGLSDSATRPGD